MQTVIDPEVEDHHHNESKQQDSQTRDCIIIMIKSLVFFSEGSKDEADDVDEARDDPDDDVVLIRLQMHDGPAPGDGYQHGGDHSLANVFEDEVEDLEDMDSPSISPVDQQMDQPIQIGHSQNQQPSVDYHFD